MKDLNVNEIVESQLLFTAMEKYFARIVQSFDIKLIWTETTFDDFRNFKKEPTKGFYHLYKLSKKIPKPFEKTLIKYLPYKDITFEIKDEYVLFYSTKNFFNSNTEAYSSISDLKEFIEKEYNVYYKGIVRYIKKEKKLISQKINN